MTTRGNIVRGAVLLAALAAAGAVAAAERQETAGFVLELPDGARARESYNGQVYFLEVRRPRVADDEELPLLRILVLPSGDVPPTVLLEKTREDLYRRLRAARLGAGAARPSRIRVAGIDLPASRVVATRDGSEFAAFEVFALEHGGQTMAGVAKIRAGENRGALDRMLAGLEPRPVTKDSVIRVEAAGVAFRVPIVTGFDWKHAAEDRVLIGHLGLPEGRAQVFIQHCGTDANAVAVGERSHAEQARVLARESKEDGGVLERSSMTVLPVAGRVLVGSRHEFALPGGGRRVAALFPVSVGPLFAGFTFVFEAGKADAMAERIAAILASVEGAAVEPSPPNRFAGFGLDLPFGRGARAAVADGRVEIAFTGPFESPAFVVERRDGPPPPLPAVADTFLVPLPGGERAAVATPDGAQVAVAFGDGHLVATISGRPGDAPALRRTFAALLAGLSPATRLGHRVDAGPFAVGVDPVRQTAVASGPAGAREIRIADAGFVVALSFAPGPVDEGGARELAAAALERLRARHEGELLSFTAREIASLDAAGRKGAAAVADVAYRDGRAGFLEADVLVGAGGTVTTEVVGAPDATRESMVRLLSTISIE